jgi:hypothetical protein
MNDISTKSKTWQERRHPRALEHHKHILREAFEAGYRRGYEAGKHETINPMIDCKGKLKAFGCRLSDLATRVTRLEKK